MDTSQRSSTNSLDTAYGLFGITERLSQAGLAPLVTMRGNRTGVSAPPFRGRQRHTIPFKRLGPAGADGNVLGVCAVQLPHHGDPEDAELQRYGVLFLNRDNENHLVWYWADMWSDETASARSLDAKGLAGLLDGPLKDAQMFNALAVALALQLGAMSSLLNQLAMVTGEISAIQYRDGLLKRRRSGRHNPGTTASEE